jgi:hypothetical protein
MAIKDKDGGVYKLRGPNPLLKNQSEWDASKIRLINLGWKDEIIEDERNPIEEIKKNSIDIGKELNLEENPPEVAKGKVVPAKDFIKEIVEPDPKPIMKPVEVVKPEPVVMPEEDKPVQINVDARMARILKERGVEYFCAPCVGFKTHMDDFYGDSYKTPVYGEKYVFDAIVVAESDLQLQFWCVKHISVNSIVYRKVKDGGERWWRIQEVEPKTGGFLARAMISDLNPDFS